MVFLFSMDTPEERVKVTPEDLEKLIVFKSTAVDVVKLFQPQMEAFTQSLSPLFKAIEKTVDAYRPYIETLTKNLSPHMIAVAKIAELYGPQMLAFLESAKKFEEFNIKLTERHKVSELILPPYFASFTMPEIYKLFEDEHKPAIEIYHDYFNSSENIEDLLNIWSEIKFYNDRLPILRDALIAHKDGKYTLSIPVFLAQIEGILCEIFEVKNHGEAKGKLNKIKFEEDNQESLLATPQFIADILINQIFQSSKNYTFEKNYPNRHPILHGKDKYYYEDKYASLRCILILDSLRLEKFMIQNCITSESSR